MAVTNTKTKVAFKINFIAFLYPNGNSLYEQTKKRKLARIKASDPVLNQESNSEEIYSVNKAVSELGGFKDTLTSIKDSLIENEIANISRSLRYSHNLNLLEKGILSGKNSIKELTLLLMLRILINLVQKQELNVIIKHVLYFSNDCRDSHQMLVWRR